MIAGLRGNPATDPAHPTGTPAQSRKAHTSDSRTRLACAAAIGSNRERRSADRGLRTDGAFIPSMCAEAAVALWMIATVATTDHRPSWLSGALMVRLRARRAVRNRRVFGERRTPRHDEITASRLAWRSPEPGWRCCYPPKLPLLIESMTFIAAGPRITTKRAGKMNNTSGKTSLTGALNARSCAR